MYEKLNKLQQEITDLERYIAAENSTEEPPNKKPKHD